MTIWVILFDISVVDFLPYFVLNFCESNDRGTKNNYIFLLESAWVLTSNQFFLSLFPFLFQFLHFTQIARAHPGMMFSYLNRTKSKRRNITWQQSGSFMPKSPNENKYYHMNINSIHFKSIYYVVWRKLHAAINVDSSRKHESFPSTHKQLSKTKMQSIRTVIRKYIRILKMFKQNAKIKWVENLAIQAHYYILLYNKFHTSTNCIWHIQLRCANRNVFVIFLFCLGRKGMEKKAE